jgi:hypothetical protein
MSRKYQDCFTCPCCGYPTLAERGGYEICPLCFWEDDGQDENSGALFVPGPNHGYTLAQARQNFKQYYTMYDPSNKHLFQTTTVKKDFLGNVVLDKVALKKKIIKKYEVFFSMLDGEAKEELWEEISKLERNLI